MEQLTAITVTPSDYEVYRFMAGYFGICKKGTHGGDCIHGGDSANEDDYNEALISEVFTNWDGTLHYTGGKYGYRIFE